MLKVEFISYFEAGATALALIFTFFNYYITLRLNSIDQRIKRLEEFEKYSKKNFDLIFKISGQLDVILDRWFKK